MQVHNPALTTKKELRYPKEEIPINFNQGASRGRTQMPGSGKKKDDQKISNRFGGSE